MPQLVSKKFPRNRKIRDNVLIRISTNRSFVSRCNENYDNNLSLDAKARHVYTAFPRDDSSLDILCSR